jgi:hypothetical protein
MSPSEQIDYSSLIRTYPWIVKRNQNCILSPDSDGFLCGLLATHLLNWKVVGFYDNGKQLLIKHGISAKECIFLDADINREDTRSIGHHMVTYNKRLSPPNFNYKNCIQANILRGFDGKNDFQRKYPFGTIHLLLGIFQHVDLITRLSASAEWPLLFTDGVWNNLFGYTENCLNWITYLKIDTKKHVLYDIFCSEDLSVYKTMQGLNGFLRARDSFDAKGYYYKNKYELGGRNKRTGDKLRLSGKNKDLINLEKKNDLYSIHFEEKQRIESFVKHMGHLAEWEYLPEKWAWDDFELFTFEKSALPQNATSKPALSNASYEELMSKNPLSMAMTSGNQIEYTLGNLS